jgi:alkylation response protein AidB-like acyl-CoA dehydrogenase
MHFALTEEETLIRDTARRFAAERLAPHAEALDRGKGRAALIENLKELARNGFSTLNTPAAFGGSEAGSVAFALSIEELGYACASTAVTMSVTNMVAEVINAVASPEQKAMYLPKLSDGTYAAGAFCLTEAGAGSDPSAMRLRAKKDGDDYVLDGEKIYITSAEYAGVFVVWALTNAEAPRGKGISVFLVPAGTPGLIVGKAERKLGQHGSATNTVTFDNCRVPASAMMGKENDGFRVAVGELAGGRIGIASLSLGIARAAMDKAKAYVKERKQFGKPIADFQGLQWMLADRETELEAARLLILNAAATKDRGEPYAKEASMAKLFASEAAHRATDTAVQMFGGAGYIVDSGVERHLRDARITRIYEGTSEIQRLVIAREMLK